MEWRWCSEGDGVTAPLPAASCGALVNAPGRYKLQSDVGGPSRRPALSAAESALPTSQASTLNTTSLPLPSRWLSSGSGRTPLLHCWWPPATAQSACAPRQRGLTSVVCPRSPPTPGRTLVIFVITRVAIARPSPLLPRDRQARTSPTEPSAPMPAEPAPVVGGSVYTPGQFPERRRSLANTSPRACPVSRSGSR